MSHACPEKRALALTRMEPPLHLRLLVSLCNDVANGSALRAEFMARIEEAAQISTQHRQLLIDVSARQPPASA